MELETLAVVLYLLDPKSVTPLSIFNLFASLSIGLLLLLLPHQYVNGIRVPAFIFAAYPSLLHALVISIMLSFVGASVSLLIGIMPRRATIRRCFLRISSVSLASTILIIVFAWFLEIFRLVLNEDGDDSFFVYSYVFQAFRKMCSASEEQQ